MSSNETNVNNEQVSIEEVDDFPVSQVPYDNNNQSQHGFGVGATTHANSFAFGNPGAVSERTRLSSSVATTNMAALNAFGGIGGTGATGVGGTNGALPSTGTFIGLGGLGGLRPATTGAVSSAGLQAGMGFGFCGGPPRPVERHPETGQPINNPPRSACGGIQPHVSQVFGNPLVGNDKKKNIENLYSKLAQTRAKIAELNKFIDEIYEILPKIQ